MTGFMQARRLPSQSSGPRAPSTTAPKRRGRECEEVRENERRACDPSHARGDYDLDDRRKRPLALSSSREASADRRISGRAECNVTHFSALDSSLRLRLRSKMTGGRDDLPHVRCDYFEDRATHEFESAHSKGQRRCPFCFGRNNMRSMRPLTSHEPRGPRKRACRLQLKH